MSQSTTRFWNWFKANSKSLADINNPSLEEDEKEKILDELLDNLHTYCDKLYFNIGGEYGGRQELTITAEGKTDYFDAVEELIKEAPELEGWSFIAFMQPGDLDYVCVFEDVELRPSEMWFLPLDNKNKPKSIGLRICLPNYELVKDSDWLTAAVFKVLDTVLGEKTLALDINYVDVKPMPDGKPEDNGLIELTDLLAFVNWKKKKLAVM